MDICIISFTEQGMALSKRLAEVFAEENVKIFTKCSFVKEKNEKIIFVEDGIGEWTGRQMLKKYTLLFIGACGIAVRAIAPYVKDKLQDVPVLVMDDLGQYVIPILSGHVGGANEIALQIAEKTGAVPVITTATDNHGKFAVDLFAKKNGLHIVNREGIAKVSAKVLVGKEITLSIEKKHIKEGNVPNGIKMVPYPPQEKADIVITTDEKVVHAKLLLRPKEYVLGMGCKRGKEAEKIEQLIQNRMKLEGISQEQIFALASIDRKKDEEGFLEWCRKSKLPFFVFSAEQLSEVKGSRNTSAFVKEQVGVDNVCERAALKACGENGILICEKYAEDGMTIAIAKREWSVSFDEK